jgi:hypothetical protein
MLLSLRRIVVVLAAAVAFGVASIPTDAAAQGGWGGPGWGGGGWGGGGWGGGGDDWGGGGW